MLDNLENKGESGDLGQITRAKNCAIGDAVAQLKMKWRKFGGAAKGRAKKTKAAKEKSFSAFATFA
jgi:hypothetical protein